MYTPKPARPYKKSQYIFPSASVLFPKIIASHPDPTPTPSKEEILEERAQEKALRAELKALNVKLPYYSRPPKKNQIKRK